MNFLGRLNLSSMSKSCLEKINITQNVWNIMVNDEISKNLHFLPRKFIVHSGNQIYIKNVQEGDRLSFIT